MGDTPRKLQHQQADDSLSPRSEDVLGLMHRLRDEFATVTEDAIGKAIDALAAASDVPFDAKLASLSALHAKLAEHIGAMRPPLPTCAPALWRERADRTETPAEFIRREYQQYLGHGLTRAHVRQLDRALYQALADWLRKNELPADIHLPTKPQQNDELLATTLPALGDSQIVREVNRLRAVAAQRHRARKNRSGPAAD